MSPSGATAIRQQHSRRSILSTHHDAAAIELRLHDVDQLFNTLDPFPFRERDLAGDAEEFIVDRAMELPKDQPIAIVVHLQPAGPQRDTELDLRSAITGWFDDRAAAEGKAIRDLFRDGRLALLIGLAALSVCMFLAWALSQQSEGPFARVLQESFIIVGWVVIWRPTEIFLYDWLPHARRRRLYRRLAAATVTVRRNLGPDSR